MRLKYCLAERSHVVYTHYGYSFILEQIVYVCVCQFCETDVFDKKVPCFVHKLWVLIHMRQTVHVCMC